MEKYIEVDLLKEEIKSSRCVMKPQYLIAGEAFEIIESQPAADVEKVRHGEWEVVSKTSAKRILRCTCCGYIKDIYIGANFPEFCERCGAKMDGGKK